MTQTLAIFVDAYRELNAKRLFWLTLLLSGLVVAVFAILGNNDRGITILHWTIDIPPASTKFIPREEFYKLVFTNLGLGVWLTWLATILALVSTASIFPDFLAGGAIELSLSKPIGRLRLYLLKYLSALLFVALQVTVFTAASFFVIGFRAGAWLPAVFLAIPLVVLVFSYLYSICALVGTLWRSTIAALLVTVLAWGLIFLVNSADMVLLMVKTGAEQRVQKQHERIVLLRTAIDAASADAPPPADPPTRPGRPTEGGLLAGLQWAVRHADGGPSLVSADERLAQQRKRLARYEARLAEMRKTHQQISRWHGLVFGIKTALPKTTETTELMERYILDWAEMERLRAPREQVQVDLDSTRDDDPAVDEAQTAAAVQRAVRSRSEVWIIGTSLGFEALLIGLAAWVFCRRDF